MPQRNLTVRTRDGLRLAGTLVHPEENTGSRLFGFEIHASTEDSRL